jgi:microcystin degradation protein MlrC
MTTNATAGFLAGARERNWELVPLSFTVAIGGPLTKEAYETAKSNLLTPLREAGTLDGVFLELHGVGAAEHLDDVEGDLLAACREIVGEAVPINTCWDQHANMTDLRVKSATMIIGHKTNPHTDYVANGRQAASAMAAIFEGSFAPASAVAWPRMLTAFQKHYITPGWPMDHIVRLAENARRRDPRIIDVTVFAGSYLTEISDAGMSVVVTTNGEPKLAREVADSISDALWAARGKFAPDMVSVEDAVREAVAMEQGPVVLGDLADSMGTGGTGESTAILAELLKQKAKSAVITVTDPEAVQEAVKAGVGSNVTLMVGGKKEPKVYGDPVRISGRVRVINDSRFVPITKTNVAMVERGLTAVIDCGDIEVILTSRPPLVFEANYFRSLGIEPTERKILVCKSEAQHHAGFANMARAIIDVDGPGPGTQDISKLHYTKIRRPIYPLDNM